MTEAAETETLGDVRRCERDEREAKRINRNKQGWNKKQNLTWRQAKKKNR